MRATDRLDWLFGLLASTALPCLAQTESSDLAALEIADRAEDTAIVRAAACPWSAEVAAAAADEGTANATGREWRGSGDIRCRWQPRPSLEGVIADRLDLRTGDGGNDDVNTLKEAFVSWQPSADQYLDFGRINARFGVANGYRPTDFFRTGSVRSVVSLDPTSLRENRQGSVMLRSQTLWPKGAFTAIFSPQLSSRRSPETFALDLGATNSTDRWLLALTRSFGKVEPQVLLFDDEHASTRIGLNLTGLLTPSIVGYLEWVGGSSKSALQEMLDLSGNEEFRSQAAAGLTWTTKRELSFTFEYAYNDLGETRSDWQALIEQQGAAAQRFRQAILDRQDMALRNGVFIQARVDDMFVPQLDASAFARVNLDDRSRLYWASLRYHFTAVDLGLQWHRFSGQPTSEYGARAGSVWQLVFTYYRG